MRAELIRLFDFGGNRSVALQFFYEHSDGGMLRCDKTQQPRKPHLRIPKEHNHIMSTVVLETSMVNS